MNTDATIVVTKEENGVSNKVIDTDFIAPCTHEEADTRMFLHAKHAAIGGSMHLYSWMQFCLLKNQKVRFYFRHTEEKCSMTLVV
jgi:hypothetical protein